MAELSELSQEKNSPFRPVDHTRDETLPHLTRRSSRPDHSSKPADSTGEKETRTRGSTRETTINLFVIPRRPHLLRAPKGNRTSRTTSSTREGGEQSLPSTWRNQACGLPEGERPADSEIVEYRRSGHVRSPPSPTEAPTVSTEPAQWATKTLRSNLSKVTSELNTKIFGCYVFHGCQHLRRDILIFSVSFQTLTETSKVKRRHKCKDAQSHSDAHACSPDFNAVDQTAETPRTREFPQDPEEQVQ